MKQRGEVLVAILNRIEDFTLLREQHWYRIPVTSVENLLKKRWPPQWLAFYQTKVFGDKAYAVNYYAQVLAIQQVYRWQLFPNDYSKKRNWHYYKLLLEPLRKLAAPIFSRRRRRIVFIPTTWEKLIHAVEINDLYDESPLEDYLWACLKRWQIGGARQEYITVKKQHYALDFAIYCAQGKLDIETDGDTWHANPERAVQDNLRDNNIETAGWKVLRFSTPQIREQTETYCLPTIAENINKLGGIEEEGKSIPRKINLNLPAGSKQLNLFDDV